MADIAADGMKFRVGRVLSRSFSVYFGNIAPFVMLALVVSSPTYIYKIVMGPGPIIFEDNPLGYWSHMGPEPVILYFVNLLLSQLVAAALVYGTIQDIRQEKATLGDCLARGAALMFPVFGIAIVYLLIMILVALVSIVPAALVVGLLVAATHSSIVAIALMPLSFIPLIIFFVRLWVTFPVAVIEGRGLGSFKRSAQLTKGSRWRIFFLLILFLALGFGISFLMQSIGSALERSSLDHFAGGVAVEWLFEGFTTALSAVLATVTYHDLRVAKEGLDTNQIASVFD